MLQTEGHYYRLFSASNGRTRRRCQNTAELSKFARGETKISPWMLSFYPVQFLTCAWMKLRLGFYGRGIFSVTDPVLPVVSIGNNSLGGTDKTPMTELAIRQFLEAGVLRPGW